MFRSRGNASNNDRFAELYKSHGANVLGLLVRLCDGDRAEAEDLTQETFIAAFVGKDAFRGRGRIRAWLLGIALRRWRDRNRRRVVATVAPVDDEFIDPATETDGFEDRSLTRLTLDDALRRLPALQREAVLLVVAQQLTHREAAQILNEPVGTVKWRVHDANRRLRNYLCALEEESNAITSTAIDRTNHPTAAADAPNPL